MSLTYAAQQSDGLGRKTGIVIAVLLLQLGFFYAFTQGLNVVKFVAPLKDTLVVFIPEETPPTPPEPMVKPPEKPIDNLVPEVAVPVETEIPPEVQVDVEPAPSAITVAPSPAVAPAQSFSITHRVNPLYPAASKRAGEAGTVLLDIVVGPNGVATEINIERSSGFAALDEAAVAAVRKWRFTVSSDSDYARVRVPVTFKLEPVS